MPARSLNRFALRIALLAAIALGVAACDIETVLRDTIIALFYDTTPKPQPADVVSVVALVETEPVLDGSDAADDPAIWVNPRDAERSYVIGTNKRRGIEVYDMQGERRWRLDAGRINNVDLRANVMVSGTARTIVAGTNRTATTIEVWELDSDTGQLRNILAEPLHADVDDPYGFCLYHSVRDGTLYAFATAKEGGAVQWRLQDTGAGTLRGTEVRRIPTETQPEGCVADDANGVLFIGEEAVGIWRVGAEPGDSAHGQLIATVRPPAEAESPSPASPHRLTADVEGLTIYAPPDADANAGYLLASSQGNWTYVVFDRAPPHAYRGTFRIADAAGIDGTGDTDGIDVVSAPLGERFPDGLLVVQDGYNVDAAGEAVNQNFKYVSWTDVQTALTLR